MAPNRSLAWRAGLALAATALTFHVACGLTFHCGCTWPLFGGSDHCDVNVAGPPDCPACASLAVGAAFSAALLAAWWTVLALSARALAALSRPPAGG